VPLGSTSSPNFTTQNNLFLYDDPITLELEEKDQVLIKVSMVLYGGTANYLFVASAEADDAQACERITRDNQGSYIATHTMTGLFKATISKSYSFSLGFYGITTSGVPILNGVMTSMQLIAEKVPLARSDNGNPVNEELSHYVVGYPGECGSHTIPSKKEEFVPGYWLQV
jgi:hypothetical protein